MWIQTPGVINEQLEMLGTRQNCIYLAKGDRYMLIGGGGQWIVPELEHQIRENQIDMDRVEYLVIGHSHYDHCGAVPYMQKRYSHIKVLASQNAAKLYAHEKAVSNMRKFSRQGMETMGLPMEFEGISLDFEAIEVSRILQDGDRVDLGHDLSFAVFETPGHSRCAISLYAPKQQWLFPTDSMAIPVGDGNEFMCTASESFVEYINSLKKLESLGIRICAWEHYGYMTGRDARGIVKRIIDATRKYKQELEKRMAQDNDIEIVGRWATDQWLEKTRFSFLPDEVMLYISKTMVKNALEEHL